MTKSSLSVSGMSVPPPSWFLLVSSCLAAAAIIVGGGGGCHAFTTSTTARTILKRQQQHQRLPSTISRPTAAAAATTRPRRSSLLSLSSSSPPSSTSSSTRLYNWFGRGGDNKKEGESVVNGVVDGVVGSSTSSAAEWVITPDGYGFTAPLERILGGDSGKDDDKGFVRAKGTDRVMDVIQAISSSSSSKSSGDGGNDDKNCCSDVALVFDDNNNNKLLGLFTESDYIEFTKARTASCSSAEESATFLVEAKVGDYLTAASDLIALSATADTAATALDVMNKCNCRHVIVADTVSENDNKLTDESNILGVIRMQQVMSVLAADERDSLIALSAKYPNIPNPMDQMRELQADRANLAASSPATTKQDIAKVATSILFAGTFALFLSQSQFLHEHADWAMIGIFVAGYLGIILEEVFSLDKAGVALLMSTGLWVTYADFFNSPDGVASDAVIGQLGEQLAEVSDICFFLLAASTIVEVVDAHQGFKVVTNQIQTTSKKQLFWIVGFLTFFLSAILNNLTVTIVMVSLLRKLVPSDQDRKLFGAMVVVAANAGGVWTPIGDVTTTMLWINHQLSTVPTILELFLPSLVCLVGSLFFLVNQVEEEDAGAAALPEPTPLSTRGKVVFWSGIASLLSVPVFNELTGLPPYLAMLTGLGAMWTLTDVLHMGPEENEEGESLTVPAALSKLDTAGILFFLGILMSIGVLDKSGLLKELAQFLSDTLPNLDIIATVIGLASALIDNVPLVAASMGMYELSDYATDDKLWQLIALCAGTGGSILVIGSASGVALMGLEKVDFLWYAKNVSIGATVGYFAGIATYLVQYAVLNGGAGLFDSLGPQAAMALDTLQQTSFLAL